MSQKASAERLSALQPLDQAHETLNEIRRPSATAPSVIIHMLRRWPILPTNWPRLPQRGAPSSFLRHDYRDLYRPGAVVEVYVGACAGLGRIANALYVPQFKIGSCAAGRVGERMRQLSRDHYAAAWSDNGDWRFDQDFNDWFASFIDCQEAPSPGGPVALTDRSFVITLPEKVSPSQFEKLLQRELRAIDARPWFVSPAGRRHCALTQAPLAISQRSTAYQIGVARRLSPAIEIYVFRRRSDPARLLRLLEAIVLRETLTPAR